MELYWACGICAMVVYLATMIVIAMNCQELADIFLTWPGILITSLVLPVACVLLILMGPVSLFFTLMFILIVISQQDWLNSDK